MGKKQPWHRLPRESNPAFEAFSMYLEAGLNRNIVGVAKALGKNVSQLYRWSSKNNWVKRSQDYDAHLAAQRLDGKAEAEKKSAKEEADEAKNRRLQIAKLLQLKGMQSLKKIDALDIKEGLKAIELGAKIERTELGMPDKILGVSGAKGEALAVNVESDPGEYAKLAEYLTADERRDLVRIINTARQRMEDGWQSDEQAK